VVAISGKPYIDEGNIRTFYSNKPNNEFVWHRDHEDREIEILEGEGWCLQFENTLPYNLNETKKVFIPKNVYHRLIKGYNDLKVKINVKL